MYAKIRKIKQGSTIVEGKEQFKIYIRQPGKVFELGFCHISPQTFYDKAQCGSIILLIFNFNLLHYPHIATGRVYPTRLYHDLILWHLVHLLNVLILFGFQCCKYWVVSKTQMHTVHLKQKQFTIVFNNEHGYFISFCYCTAV